MAQPRCVWSILIASRSFCGGLAEHLPKELARIYAVRSVVRAGVDTTWLFQVRAKVAGSGFLLDHGFLATRTFRIVGEDFEWVQVDIAVGAITRAQAAADAPVLDDDFQRIAALAAGRGYKIVFETQAVTNEARDTVVGVGAGIHAGVASRAVLQVENE